MSERLTDERLARLEALAAASPGPWVIEGLPALLAEVREHRLAQGAERGAVTSDD